MKTKMITLIIGLLTVAGITAKAQERPAEYLGLPGDNLNLYAVMQLFQESETLEGFERRLNEENSRVNNLDLNGDNLIDYITVNDYPDGNVHTIVLRVALSPRESQDVAVFTVERNRDGSVQIQLIGDEDLYGRNYIIEPNYGDGYAETPNPGYTGRPVTRERRVTIEVAAWPLISYIYLPGYVTWRSRWYWGYWPAYWHAWRPYYWDYYYGYHSCWFPHYYSHFRHWHTPRIAYYHNHYYSDIRVHSQQVRNRINEGRYRDTYSRPDLKREGIAAGSRTRVDRATSRGNSAGSRTKVDGTTSRGNTKSAVRSLSGTENGVSRRSNTMGTQRSNSSSVRERGTNTGVTSQSGGRTRGTSDVVTSRNSNGSGSGRIASPSGQTKSASRPSYGQARTSSNRPKASSQPRVSSRSGSTKSASVSQRSSSGSSGRISSGRISSGHGSTKSASVSQRSSSGSSGRISSGHASSSRGSSAGVSSRGGGGSSRGGSGSSSRR